LIKLKNSWFCRNEIYSTFSFLSVTIFNETLLVLWPNFGLLNQNHSLNATKKCRFTHTVATLSPHTQIKPQITQAQTLPHSLFSLWNKNSSLQSSIFDSFHFIKNGQRPSSCPCHWCRRYSFHHHNLFSTVPSLCFHRPCFDLSFCIFIRDLWSNHVFLMILMILNNGFVSKCCLCFVSILICSWVRIWSCDEWRWCFVFIYLFIYYYVVICVVLFYWSVFYFWIFYM